VGGWGEGRGEGSGTAGNIIGEASTKRIVLLPRSFPPGSLWALERLHSFLLYPRNRAVKLVALSIESRCSRQATKSGYGTVAATPARLSAGFKLPGAGENVYLPII